mmetsp:Transcript_13302/g.53016  ORF Transcript_13302/g.53016 Transcript_13302/m.53016 type:complete len:101 (+) Transcript_13302:12-314(+)
MKGGRLLFLLGCVLLVHCAVSVNLIRRSSRSMLEPFEGVPGDLQIEAVVAFLACIAGIVLAAPKFELIKLTDVTAAMSWNGTMETPDFEVFAHRGTRMHG